MVLARNSIFVLVLAFAVILIFTITLVSQFPAVVFAACTSWARLLDNDCDGLANVWETTGYDINGDTIIDLTFPGANPEYSDIYLEIDYMTNHKPRTGVVEAVVAAFGAAPINNPNGTTGINLHVLVNDQIPHTSSITMWSGFDALKNTWFVQNSSERSNTLAMQAKDNSYHYALFAHQYNGGSSSGIAELPGDDLVVSLGAPGWGTFNGHTVGSIDQQKGTLMHELGHNLKLRHGGNVDENCKPQYLSVMSYSYQFPNFVSDRRLDYSRSQLNTLDENALIEQNGISPASAPPGQKAVWGFNGMPQITQPLSQPLNPIDWNKNGIVSGTSSVNINNLGSSSGCTSTLKTILEGFNDWMHIIYWGTSGGWANGTSTNEGAGIGNFTAENATNVVSMIDAASIVNRAVGINTIQPVNATNLGEGLITSTSAEDRPGLDEFNVENLISSRVSMLESIISDVDSIPDEDLTNATSKDILINGLRTIGDNFNLNSTNLLPSISGLTQVRDQVNDLVTNQNTQKLLIAQMDNFIEALKKQQ